MPWIAERLEYKTCFIRFEIVNNISVSEMPKYFIIFIDVLVSYTTSVRNCFNEHKAPEMFPHNASPGKS